MKLLKELKPVTYFGINLLVPQWTKFIATDQDGLIYAYEGRPVTGLFYDWVNEYGDNAEHIERADLEGMDWKQTLVEVV
jgi:hypothetical protein